MKLKAFIFSMLSCGVLAGCDQWSQANPDGDIIVIGNGILNLNESDGVIADVEHPEVKGLVSVIVSPSQTESLVRERSSMKEIPTYFNWATSGEKSDPVLKLDIRQVEKKCRYFEALQNGDLVCRRDLESLDISPEKPPVFSAHREVFYVDTAKSLHRLYEGKSTKLVEKVERFFLDRDSNLYFYGESNVLGAWREDLGVVFLSADSLLSKAAYPFRGKDGLVYFLISNDVGVYSSGVYRMQWSKDIKRPFFERVYSWDSTLEVLLSATTKEQNTQVLSVIDREGVISRLQISDLGIQTLGEVVQKPEPSAATAATPSVSVVQQVGESLLSSEAESRNFNYCRKGINGISSCASLPMAEGRETLDAILKTPNDVYILSMANLLDGEKRYFEHFRWNEELLTLEKVHERILEEKLVRFRAQTEALTQSSESEDL